MTWQNATDAESVAFSRIAKENGDVVRILCVPQKPLMCVACTKQDWGNLLDVLRTARVTFATSIVPYLPRLKVAH